MAIAKPHAGTYPEYYSLYLNTVQGEDLILALQNNRKALDALVLEMIGKADHSYAPGKWTIKEVLLHLIDTERIFAYRALTFARADKAELPGFDENEYARHYPADKRTLQQVYAEFKVVRDATIHLFQSLNEEAVLRSGIANGKPISVSALGYAIVGHANHHFNVIKERYL